MPTSTKKFLVFLPFLSVVIMSCNTKPSIQPIDSSSTVNDLAKSSTSTKTPSPIKTLSSTPEPIASSFITPTLPLGTLNALATMDILVTKRPEVGEFYSWNCMISPCYVSGLGLSPNGNWAAFFSAKESGGLSIVSTDGKKQWNIYFSDITGSSCPCGDATVEIERWSKDGTYLYVIPNDGSDGGFEYFWQSKTILVRMNLDSGTWVDTKMGSAFSFSPNEKIIAYRLGQDLVIHEFSTGNERIFRVPKEYKAFGRFTWSPDSKKIIFVASINNLEQEEPPDGFTLYLLDLDRLSMNAILEKDDRYLYPIEWLSENTILLESMFETQNGKLQFSGKEYQLNLETNEISIKE